MLIKITHVTLNGEKISKVISSDIIKEIEEDTREESQSNSIIFCNEKGGNRRYYVLESMDELMGKLG